MLRKSRKFRNLQRGGGKKKVSKSKPQLNKFLANSSLLLTAIAAISSTTGTDAAVVKVSADGEYPRHCTGSKCITYKVTDLGKLHRQVQSNWMAMTTPEEKEKSGGVLGYLRFIYNAMVEGAEHGPDVGSGSVRYRDVNSNFNPANPFPVATVNDLQGLYNPGAQLGQTMTEQRINTLSNPVNSAMLKKGRVLTNAKINRLTRSSRNARERNRQHKVKGKGKGSKRR